jgi:hypothetical protein
MTGPLPHREHDLVLAEVKAKPYGRPTAGLDPGCGRRQNAANGNSPRTKIHQFHVFTVSGDCRTSCQ